MVKRKIKEMDDKELQNKIVTSDKLEDYKNILVGVDDSPDAQLAFQYSIKQAKEDHSKLTITSILEEQNVDVITSLSRDRLAEKQQEVLNKLEDYKKIALKSGVKEVETITAIGDAGETIVRQIIPTVNPDLVIVGSLSKRGVTKYFGSQAAYVAKYSPVSVMVVR